MQTNSKYHDIQAGARVTPRSALSSTQTFDTKEAAPWCMAGQEREPLTMSTGASRYGAATPDAPLAGGTDATDLKLWTGTFNLHHKMPSVVQIREWLATSAQGAGDANVDDYDAIAIGCQECPPGPAWVSMLFPCVGKGKWLALLRGAVGANFVLLEKTSLGGIHLAVFVKKELRVRFWGLNTSTVACGFFNAFNNKVSREEG